MSISSHLTPEPERRLWVIFENMRHAVEWSDRRIAGLTAFAAAELALIKLLAPAGPLATLALLALSAVLPLGVFAFYPFNRLPKWLRFLEPSRDKHSIDDCLIYPDDLAKYTHSELVHRLDKYLGGGITATPYHEDLVGQIVVHARIAARKQRLFRAACILAGIGQFCIFGQLLRSLLPR